MNLLTDKSIKTLENNRITNIRLVSMDGKAQIDGFYGSYSVYFDFKSKRGSETFFCCTLIPNQGELQIDFRYEDDFDKEKDAMGLEIIEKIDELIKEKLKLRNLYSKKEIKINYGQSYERAWSRLNSAE